MIDEVRFWWKDHLARIARDPALWLASEQDAADPDAYEILFGHAEHLVDRLGTESEHVFLKWAKRYNLDPSVASTRFLHSLCRETLGEVSRSLDELREQMANLQQQTEALQLWQQCVEDGALPNVNPVVPPPQATGLDRGCAGLRGESEIAK